MQGKTMRWSLVKWHTHDSNWSNEMTIPEGSESKGNILI